MSIFSKKKIVSNKLLLYHNKGFAWTSYGSTHVKGYAHLSGECLQGEALAKKLDGYSAPELPGIIKSLKGNFAIIVRTAESLIATVDQIRSFPLFFAYDNGVLLISDSAEEIRSQLNINKIPSERAAEYLNATMVTSNETLYPGLYQLCAGELIHWEKKHQTSAVFKYFEYWRDENLIKDANEEDLFHELDSIHLNIFTRLAESLNNRLAVIPLSGGEDSRLIAWMLDRVGYDKVRYITYGPPKNWEAVIAREVANNLSGKWQFEPTDHQYWYNWFNSEERQQCTTYADGFNGFPHIQDFPVVGRLTQCREIPEDAVFIPGHSGGLLTGNQTPANMANKNSVSADQLIAKILHKNYSAWNLDEVEPNFIQYFKQKIVEILNLPDEFDGSTFCDLSEYWEWQERQGNYIINSLRVYEYWGYEWRLPLWDIDLTGFWNSVPANLRADRYLFRKYIETYQNLPVTEANSPKLRKLNYFKNPFINTRYGRFGDKSVYTKRLKNVATPLPFNFIKPKRRVMFHSVRSISGLIYLNELLDRTNSELL